MGLETGTYINSLNSANPLGTDLKSQGDDHLRLIKTTILNTFPNITGEVSATHTELNYVDVTTLGTAQASKALTASAGSAFDFNNFDMANVDINSGAIDGVTIGAASAITQLVVDNIDINLNTISTTSGNLILTPVAGSNITLDTSVTIDGGAVDITGDLDVDNINIDGNTISATVGSVTLGSAWTAAGQTCADLGTVTTADINGGTIDGTTQASGTINGPIAAGGTWTAAAAWTLPAITLGGTVTSNGQSFSGTIADLGSVTTVDINGGSVDGATIGAASASTIVGTTITGTTITANTGLVPDANDGAYIGQAGTAFSDLFLASGAVINFDSSNVTITHAAGSLTVAGATAVSLGTSAAFTAGTIELGAAADTTISRSAAGVVACEGNALEQVGLNDMYVPAAAMRPATTNGCGNIANYETTALRPDIVGLPFDTAADEFAQFNVAMPKSWNEGTVTATVYWSAAAGSGTVAWFIQGVACSEGDTIDVAYGTAVSPETDTLTVLEDLHVTSTSSAITIAGTPTAGDDVFFQIYRDVSADTLSDDAILIGVKIHYTTDGVNDA